MKCRPRDRPTAPSSANLRPDQGRRRPRRADAVHRGPPTNFNSRQHPCAQMFPMVPASTCSASSAARVMAETPGRWARYNRHNQKPPIGTVGPSISYRGDQRCSTGEDGIQTRAALSEDSTPRLNGPAGPGDHQFHLISHPPKPLVGGKAASKVVFVISASLTVSTLYQVAFLSEDAIDFGSAPAF